MVTGSSHSISMWPPHSPTRMTKKSILKLPGAFHWPKTSRILFWAFSYSIGEPCGRSNQLITYFIVPPVRKGVGGHELTDPELTRRNVRRALYFFSRRSPASLRNVGRKRLAAFA